MNNFSFRILVAFAALVHAVNVSAVELDGLANLKFAEQYAFATNRGAVLESLRPRTRAWYTYSILDAQNEGRLDVAARLLAEWGNLRGTEADPKRLQALRVRQQFLEHDASQSPDRAQSLVRQAAAESGIVSAPAPRETELAPNTYPAELDPAKISFESFWKHAGSRSDALEEQFSFIPMAGFGGYADPEFNLDPGSELLPDTPGLYEAVRKYLNDGNPSHVFSNARVFRSLTLKQLDSLAKDFAGTKNDLRNNPAFIETVMSKLEPSHDERRLDADMAAQLRRNPEVCREVLGRKLEFARTLPASQSKYRLAALTGLLELGRSRGDYSNLALFKEYLQVSRPDGNPMNLRGSLNSELVRDYLAAARRAGSDLKEYAQWVDGAVLARVIAETDLLAGKPAAEVNTKVFTDAEFRQLHDRVELNWAKSNPRELDADDEVALDLEVKNVKSLRLAIYELDGVETLRRYPDGLPNDLDLDGCVPNVSRTVKLSAASPMVRSVVRLKLPELARGGLYMVECSAAGISSRAVVRKGCLRVVDRDDASGHLFSVLDERGGIVKGAKLWLGDTVFAADEDGIIHVPFAPPDNEDTKTAVIACGRIVTVVRFRHLREQYLLSADGMLLGESLVAGSTATLIFRPRLSVNSMPVPISLLRSPRLTLTFNYLDGSSSVTTVENFKLEDDAEAVHRFKVPARLAGLEAMFSGTVHRLAKDDDVTESARVYISRANGIAKTDQVEQLFLRRGRDGYTVEIRGRNGEPRPARAVNFLFKHRCFKKTCDLTLQADAQGVVKLGRLEDIESVTAIATASERWNLEAACTTELPVEFSAVEGEVFEIPLRGLLDGKWPGADRLDARVSLLAKVQSEIGEDVFAEDCIRAVSYSNGTLRVAGLAPGDYQLGLRTENDQCILHVLRPVAKRLEVAAGVLVGRNRGVEDSGSPSRMRIADALVGGDGRLQVKLEHATPATRVHVFATRFQADPMTVFRELSEHRDLRKYEWNTVRNDFISGRQLGDKLRYVLERRGQPHRPGTLLAHPSLLLTPWCVSESNTREHQYQDGEGWKDDAVFESISKDGQCSVPFDGESVESQNSVDGFCLDFLSEGAKIWTNLRPDANGRVELALPAGLAHQDFTVVAFDGRGLDGVKLLGETCPPAMRDLRLVSGLDPAKTTVLAKSAKVVKGRMDEAGARSYATIGDVRKLLVTLNLQERGQSDPDFDEEYAFVANWAKLPEKERRELYGKYACHELDFFLYCKDQAFFRSVVAPNLRNKRFKQFMDKWLLDEDVSVYAEPGSLQNLNALEQCLLARRVPALAKSLVRRFSDWCAAHPVSPSVEDRRFDAALGRESPDAPVDLVKRIAADNPPPHLTGAPRALRPAIPAATLVGSKNGLIPQMEALPVAAAKPVVKRSLRKENTAQLLRRRAEMRKLYAPPEKTKEWVETHSRHRRHSEGTLALVPINRFWRDYASAIASGRTAEFLSPEFIHATSSFTEMLAVLSILSLPFAEVSDGAAIVFAQRTQNAAASSGADIAVVQRFCEPADRSQNNVQAYVADEFVQGQVYELLTVVTNPSERDRRLSVFRQIPEGAIALGGSRAGESMTLKLEPYSVQLLLTQFYFPSAVPVAGDFVLYPATVTEGGALVGRAQSCCCKVVARSTKVDKTSWSHISQNGSNEEVLEFLRNGNLQDAAVDLAKIGWRMRDETFMLQVFKVLDERGIYHEGLWRCALGARRSSPEIEARLGQLFAQRDNRRKLARMLGPCFQSRLASIDPEVTDIFEHREHWPLINARAHTLGGSVTIVNDGLARDYRAFLDVLATKRTPTADDRLLAAVYLLAQDRVDEAKALVEKVRPDEVATKMQFDYLQAYLAFCEGRSESAFQIARAYRDYPVKRWRELFAEMVSQADEIAGRTPADKLLTDAESAPSVALTAEAVEAGANRPLRLGEFRLTARNLAECMVRAYPVDMEINFSKNPFGEVPEGQDALACLRPTWETKVALGADGRASVVLPKVLSGKSLVLEAVGADGRARSRLEVSPARFDVQVVKEYGRIRVRNQEGRALPGTYVKVYSRDESGRVVKFHKDGYTDLRGIFDYASVSTDSDFKPVEFSVLVLHDQHGAKTLKVVPPGQ